MERIIKFIPPIIFGLIQDKRFRIFSILFITALIIWFGGPYIAIAGHSFLANSNHRLIAVLFLAVIWGLSNLRITNSLPNSSATKKQLPAATLSRPKLQIDPTFAEIKQLQKIFKKTLQLIKQSQKKPFWFFSSLPTYITLGANQSGKTSLLTQANLDNPLPLINEKYYDGWLINNTLFFDYIQNEALTKSTFDTQLLWQQFLKLLKKHQHKLPLNGVIVTIDLSQLFNQSPTFDIQKTCQQLQEMATFFQQLPVYLIFTHCDLIAGFTDFFEDLNQEERTQALGFSFPNIKTTRNFTEVFEIQLNTLLKRLNERLIWRLHQEHNPQKRARIKDFPLQLEILKGSISNLVNQIGNVTHVKLCGSYFSSCSQQQTPINFLTTALDKTFNIKQHTQTPQNRLPQHKSYFTEQLFQQIIAHSANSSPAPYLKSKQTYLIYTSALAIILGCSSFWYQNYAANITTINALQLAIASNKHSNYQNDPYDFLPTLNALYLALDKINHHHSLWRHLGLQQADQVKITAQQSYQTILTTRFLPMLKKIVETKIQTSDTQNPNNLYGALKAYLMLTDLTHRDPQFLQQWFTAYWQQQLPDNITAQKELLAQLNGILKQTLVINANSQIITTARNNLNQIPLSQLSYSVLLDHYNQPIALFDKNDAFSLKDNYTIPALFTAANFNDIFNHQISNACQEVINGNWVLGAKNSSSSTITLDQLVTQLQSYYLNQYANAWSELLTNLTLTDFQDLNQTAHILKTLSGNNSPLWQLLNNIGANTIANQNVQFNLIVSNKFQALNTFIQSPALSNFQQSIMAAKNYFTKISDASDSNKAAFTAAAKRMDDNNQNDALENLLQQSSALPQPLQNWTNLLVTKSWHLLLLTAQSYLNQVWASSVLPPYNDYLNNKYPLFKDASSDADLENFANFFAPEGIIDNFFNTYLKPFVDMRNVYWVWKTVDNDRIGIPQTTLEMFIRAALIQKMYFANNSDQPFVKFTLIPLAIEPDVVDFNLNMEGQMIDYQPNHAPQIIALSWPGPDPNKVIMQFTNDQGKLSTTTETGPWALFRLLAKANLQTAWDNPKQFKITFDLNGNSVKYQLVASDLVNPFISGIVDVFRCPDKL